MPRSPRSARDAAEAAFRSATTKPVEVAPAPKAASVPNARETVSLLIDRDVLERSQEDGPGW